MEEKIGDKIKTVRKLYGISQEALAKNICSQSEVSRIESNTHLPSYYVLLRLSNRLGVDINYFLENEEESQRNDYLLEVKSQLAEARRQRDYSLLKNIVEFEIKNPLFKKGPIRSYLLWHKGIYQYHLDKEFEKSIKTLLSCLSHQNKSLLFTELDINLLNSIGIIYRNESLLEKALEHLGSAYQMVGRVPSIRDRRLFSKVSYNLSKVYTDLERYVDSLKVCEKGIIECKKNEDMFLFAEFHYQIGRNYFFQLSIEDGLSYLEKAKTIYSLQSKEHLKSIVNEEINYFKDNFPINKSLKQK
ncbi:helix-turn-helix domain-containing protein [Halobacillus trueperi]|nr:helix-turn-helix domain-containing protein [Halobacillus trueperi]